MTEPEKGKAPARHRDQPHTKNLSTKKDTRRHQGDAGFLCRASSGKAIGVVDPWGDDRDELTSRQQLERVVSIYERHAFPASPFRAKRMMMMSAA